MLALTPRIRELALLVLASGIGCAPSPPARELRILTGGGDAAHGPALLTRHGCVACHTIRDLPHARGRVGPPLDGIGRRPFIAGRLENTPANLVDWVRDARRMVPGTAMPSLGVPEQEARDIAAYLYSLR